MTCAPSEDSVRPVWSESSLCTWRNIMPLTTPIERTAKTLIRLGACLGWSESAQADPSRRFAHMPFCMFCHEMAQLLMRLFEIFSHAEVFRSAVSYPSSDVLTMDKDNKEKIKGIPCNHYQHLVFWDKIWAVSWQNQQSECAPSKDSDQPGHPPKLSSCRQRRLWSDWADAQADLSLPWAHNHIVGFVMRRLIKT